VRVTGLWIGGIFEHSHQTLVRLRRSGELDGFNGLLLSLMSITSLTRYVSFSDLGDLLVSKELNHAVLESWGIALRRTSGRLANSSVGILHIIESRLREVERWPARAVDGAAENRGGREWRAVVVRTE